MNIVEVSSLIKKYNNIMALNNISLNIEESKIYGLLGPNGSGKSTLINILSGILKFDSGKCYIFQKDINNNRNYIKKYIGVVPQEYSFYDDLKVKENLELFGRLYGLRGKVIEERIDRIIKKLDLYQYKDRYPAEFSGGMKRRVNIACSIIHNPKILIMDEPTASLDPIARDYVLNCVKNINKEGCTIVYTSHYLEEVEELCDKVAILNKGILITEGKPKEIGSFFSKRNIIDISINKINDSSLFKLNNIKKEILFLNDININVDVEHSNINISCNNPSITLEKILAFLRENKISIKDINVKKATLEENFIRLVK